MYAYTTETMSSLMVAAMACDVSRVGALLVMENYLASHDMVHQINAVAPPEMTLDRAKPLLPQTKAELMAGRIPLDAQHADIPMSLRQVVVGPTTAREIGWPSP